MISSLVLGEAVLFLATQHAIVTPTRSNIKRKRAPITPKLKIRAIGSPKGVGLLVVLIAVGLVARMVGVAVVAPAGMLDEGVASICPWPLSRPTYNNIQHNKVGQ